MKKLMLALLECRIVSLLFGSLRGEVWIEPGKLPSQGKCYRDKEEAKDTKESGKISLVLGKPTFWKSYPSCGWECSQEQSFDASVLCTSSL